MSHDFWHLFIYKRLYNNVFIIFENFRINFHKQISRLNTLIYQHLHFIKQISIFATNQWFVCIQKNLKYLTYIISICITNKVFFRSFFGFDIFELHRSNRSNSKFLSLISIRHQIRNFSQLRIKNFAFCARWNIDLSSYIWLWYRFTFFVWFFRFFRFDSTFRFVIFRTLRSWFIIQIVMTSWLFCFMIWRRNDVLFFLYEQIVMMRFKAFLNN